MRPVSDAFLRAVRGSHRMVARARIVAPGQSGTNPVGTEIRIIRGDVQIDGTAEIRSTLDLTTDGNSAWPTRASDDLTPYGNEAFVERGVAYGNGTVEWCSLGYFRLESLEQDDAPNGPIRVTAKDRMAAVIEAKFLAPRQFAAGTSVGSVFTSLVGEVLPDVTIEWDDSTSAFAFGRTQTVEDDRYKFLADLVTAYGKIWYFDHRGVLVIETPPEPTVPVFLVDGGEGGVLTRMGRRLTREGSYNAVVATGEAADTVTPVRGVAIDDNSNSPTYWYGAFGKVPRFFPSPLITTNAQAALAARSMLVRAVGLPYAVDFTAVPNPALQPYDSVRVDYSATRRSEIHVIDRLTVPLDAQSALTASTREQSLVVVGSA